MVTGLAVLWRSRRSYGSRRRTFLRRALTLAVSAALAFAIFWLVVFPVGFAYTYTHTGRGVVQPDLRVPYEQVTVTTSDGLELTGPYVPSKNRAAVILFPGATRSPEARMLIRHGYGVLLLDPRGQGRAKATSSAGRATGPARRRRISEPRRTSTTTASAASASPSAASSCSRRPRSRPTSRRSCRKAPATRIGEADLKARPRAQRRRCTLADDRGATVFPNHGRTAADRRRIGLIAPRPSS